MKERVGKDMEVGEETQKNFKTQEEWRVCRTNRLNQKWVRHRCISRRPFQVESVTQREAATSR